MPCICFHRHIQVQSKIGRRKPLPAASTDWVLPNKPLLGDNHGMTKSTMYKRYRFPPDIIQYAVWLYFRFNLSHRDIEDLLAERGITVSHESIRLWCNKFGSRYAAWSKRKHQGYGDTFFIDEVFIKINGKQHYLWRAVDQDGEVVDVFLQKRRDAKAAKRFFKRIL